MAENKQSGERGVTSPQTSQQKSPQVSTRSRDEIERDIGAMRDQRVGHDARPDPETVRDRARRDAEAHRAAHSGSGGPAAPRAAAHDPARKDGAYEPVPQESSRESARRFDDDRDKSSAQLEREVEYERHQLTRTLDQIRRRVSPGELMEQAWGYARDAGGSEFVRNFGRSVRDNPLPVVLVGAGIGWLMMSGSSGSSSTRSSDGSDGGVSRMRERASGIGGEVSDRTGQAADAASGVMTSAKEGLHRATDRATAAFDSASETGSAVASRARETMQHTGDAARSSMHHATEYAQDARDGMQRSFARLAEEQPLALGAIGIAVGAAIAAMLPPTRIEDRLMGQTSDALKDRVKGSVERQYEHARDVVEETAKEVSKEFEGRGITPQAATDAAVGATRKAGEAAKEVAEGAKSEVKQQADTKVAAGSTASTAGFGKASGETKAATTNPPGTSGGTGALGR